MRAEFLRLRALGQLRGPDLARALAQLARQATASASLAPITGTGTGTGTGSAGASGTITGVIRGVHGAALPGACVTATGHAGTAFAMSGPDGRYVLTNLRPGQYVLAYRDCAAPGRYFSQWSGGAAWPGLAARVSVSAGQVAVVAPATLRPTNPAALLTPTPRLQPAPSTGRAGAADTGRISGIVTGNGHPLNGICVTVWRLIRNGAAGFNARTSRTGRYTASRLPRGHYQVQFAGDPLCDNGNWLQQWYKGITTASPFPPGNAATISLGAGQAVSGIDAQLKLGGQISGTVTSKSGRGLRGICVNVTGAVSGGLITVGFPTGSGGRYALHGVFPGRYIAGFTIGCGSHGNYAPQWWRDSSTLRHAAKIRIAGRRIVTHVDAVLAPGAAITGVVRAINSSGQALGGVCVNATNRDGSIGVSAPTRPDGSYRLAGLGTGKYLVQFDPSCGGATSSKYLGDQRFVTVKAGTTTSGVDAFLQVGAGISGTVTDSHKNPVNGICVQVQGSQGANSGTRTGPAGTYSIEGLPPDSYTVQFSGGCGSTGSYAPQLYHSETNVFDADPVALTAGSVTTGIDAAMQPGGTIAGDLTGAAAHQLAAHQLAGRPLNGICVGVISHSLAGAGAGIFLGFTRDGSYRIPNLAPGLYTVDFTCGTGRYADQLFRSAPGPSSADLVSVNPGVVTGGIGAVLSPAGAITGVVTNTAGRRLSGMCVIPVRLRGSAAAAVATTYHGSYRIGGLSAGTYDVQFVDCSGLATYGSQWYKDKATMASATPIRVAVGGTTTGIGAVMTPGGSIAGRVRSGSTHAPLRDICVIAFDPATLSLGLTATDLTGRYALTGLATGRYQVTFGPCTNRNLVTITRPGTVHVTAPHATTGINATLSVGGTVAGTVLGGSPTAKPLTGVCVDIAPVGQNNGVGLGFTAQDGSYAVTALPAGSYQVLFDDPTCPIGNTAFAPQWYNNKASQSTADVIAVTAGNTTSPINATLLPGGLGAITGTVTGPSSAAVGGECVTAFPISAALGPLFNGGAPEIGVTAADGSYVLRDLLPGTYKVRFDVGCGDSGFRTQWWDNAATANAATIITVSANAATTGISATLSP